MGELGTFLPAGGAVGVLTMVIAYLLTSNRTDRREYQEAIDRAESRADAAEARTRTEHQRAEALQQAVDEARAARRAAEDRAAALARELDHYRRRDGMT